ncbi:MAG: recombinase family protein, partial [Vicinamibacteria bacterium]
MKRVAFYTRISTDEDKQKYSLDAQRDRLEAFCKGVYGDTGYTLVEVFRDTESGAHLNRPALTRMLADAEAGRFDELIVFRVDRLSRKLN